MLRHIYRPRLLYIFAFAIALLFIGSIVFMELEGWHFIDALYFTASTMTSVGYGDLVPQSNISKLLATGYMLLTVPLLMISVGVLVEEIWDDKIDGGFQKIDTL